MAHAFISYAHENEPYVAQLVRFLNSHGIPVWMDHAIHTGDRFGEYIESAIEACAVFIPLITDESRRSDWVRDEIAYARAHNKPILPLRLSGAPPIDLGRYAFEDVSGNRLPQSAFVLQVKQLVESAKRGDAPPQVATSIPAETVLAPTPPPARPVSAPPVPVPHPPAAPQPPAHQPPAPQRPAHQPPAPQLPAHQPPAYQPPAYPPPAHAPHRPPAAYPMPARAPQPPPYYAPAPASSHSSFWGYAIGAGVLLAVLLCVFVSLF